jgi:hypothetical protein
VFIGADAFLDNQLASITMPENLFLDDFHPSFDDNFDMFYNANEERAGVYIRDRSADDSWVFDEFR